MAMIVTPTITISDVELDWTAGPATSTKYRIKRNGKVIKKLGNVLTYAGVELQNLADGVHTFQILALTTANKVLEKSLPLTLVTVPEVPEEEEPPPNVAPTAIDDAYTTAYETPKTVSAVDGVLANDSDPEDDVITVTGFEQPANGEVDVAADGSFIYTPDDGFDGDDTFAYTITDAPGLTATATVTITVEEAPEPPTPPGVGPDPGTFYGAGKDTTGGAGGTVYRPANFSELRTYVENTTGARIVALRSDVVYDGNGVGLNIKNPNITVKGPGKLVRTWYSVKASNVILFNHVVRTGDEPPMDVANADPVSTNGSNAIITNIMFDHMEMVWGPDVGGLTFLNKTQNATVQFSIIGAGLYLSNHIEGVIAQGGHSYAFNISDLGGSGGGIPTNITAYRNLITTSDGRLPRVIGALGVDVVNNVIYNFRQSPEGNPQGLNLVNNWFRSGPAAGAAGKAYFKYPWKALLPGSGTHATSGLYPLSVYVAGNVGDGFTIAAPSAPAAVLKGSVVHAYKGALTPEATGGSPNLLERVLADVGPLTKDTITQGWIDACSFRQGLFYNGAGKPGPNPVLT